MNSQSYSQRAAVALHDALLLRQNGPGGHPLDALETEALLAQVERLLNVVALHEMPPVSPLALEFERMSKHAEDRS